MALIKLNSRSSPSGFGNSNKNLLLNGDFAVCQRTQHRGATVTSSMLSGSNQVHIDRWHAGGSGGTSNIECDLKYHDATGNTVSDTGFKNAMHIDVTTGSATLHADNYVYTQQRIETKNLANRLFYGYSEAKAITLSFWVYSSVTGKYGVSLVNRTDDANASTYRRRNIMSYTVNAANTWEKKTVTFVGDTDTNFKFGITRTNQAPYLGISWHWAAGTNRIASSSSDYTSEGVWYTDSAKAVEYLSCNGQVNAFSSANNNIYLTGCQLEIGTDATDFEYRSFQSQMDECHRYLYVGTHGHNMTDSTLAGETSQTGRYYSFAYGSAAGFVPYAYPTVMYRLPDLTYSTAGGAVSTDYSRNDGFQLYDSDDQAWRVYGIIADAELGS